MNLEPYQLRVIKERDELEEKCDTLYAFCASKYFEQELAEDNKELLRAQYYAMKVYLHILEQRIRLF